MFIVVCDQQTNREDTDINIELDFKELSVEDLIEVGRSLADIIDDCFIMLNRKLIV